MTEKVSSARRLLGDRTPRGVLQPEQVLVEALALAQACRRPAESKLASLEDVKRRYAQTCRAYYTLAAVSRRRELTQDVRENLLGSLFRVRAEIEQAALNDFEAVEDRESMLRTASNDSFFGYSAKQGVSIRYALASCTPTTRCGGRCYAHDGRDRELHILFRAVLNYWLGSTYENADAAGRRLLLCSLRGAIDKAVRTAVAEADRARESGHERQPRIRFSHIGEMAATPVFTNDLAKSIHERDRTVACVIYTRHPAAAKLDTEHLVVNFTLEGSEDPRRKLVPGGARIVASAWGGELNPLADVNFLEHHTLAVAGPRGSGRICPVTEDHARFTTCDGARCDRCFRQPLLELNVARRSGRGQE